LKRILEDLAAGFGVDLCTAEFARHMDAVDPLKDFRSLFAIPLVKDLPCVDDDIDGEEEVIYLCGNSLGLKPKKADGYIQNVLDAWAQMYFLRIVQIVEIVEIVEIEIELNWQLNRND